MEKGGRESERESRRRIERHRNRCGGTESLHTGRLVDGYYEAMMDDIQMI